MNLKELPGVADNDYWNSNARGSVRVRIPPVDSNDLPTYVYFWVSRAKGKEGMVFASMKRPWHKDPERICAHGVEGAFVAAKMKGWVK